MARSNLPHLNLCTPGQSIEENINTKELNISIPNSKVDNYYKNVSKDSRNNHSKSIMQNNSNKHFI